MKAARWNTDIGRHRAIDSIAETEPPRVQIVNSLTDKCRIRRYHRGCFAHHAVTFLEAEHAPAKSGNRTCELVTEDYWIIHFPALVSCVLMQIASADSYCMNTQQNVFISDLRKGKLPKLYRVGLLRVIN